MSVADLCFNLLHATRQDCKGISRIRYYIGVLEAGCFKCPVAQISTFALLQDLGGQAPSKDPPPSQERGVCRVSFRARPDSRAVIIKRSLSWNSVSNLSAFLLLISGLVAL